MTGVLLQVRLDSTRLPRKALANLGGLPLVVRCMRALKRVNAQIHALVTDAASIEDLEPWARSEGWKVFAGSPDNVLDRYVQASRNWGITEIIRATGDNPLVSANWAWAAVQERRLRDADFAAIDGLPLGTGVEVVLATALERAWAGSPDLYEREHVSPYLYRRPQEFRITRVPATPAVWFPQGRVTVDTAEDLEYVRDLWRDQDFSDPPEIEEFLSWLQQHHR